ncbi:hypothetical protein [Bacillus cereus]|uniref:hypothetical protein n=1 Tax=Bacillus cereus TaxID=1396 RepID=UPI001879AA7D|nr:hypothetical protein [Bacillus cereus]MBE7123674.1 hypothetical protein [Bacillus cereus]
MYGGAIKMCAKYKIKGPGDRISIRLKNDDHKFAAWLNNQSDQTLALRYAWDMFIEANGMNDVTLAAMMREKQLNNAPSPTDFKEPVAPKVAQPLETVSHTNVPVVSITPSHEPVIEYKEKELTKEMQETTTKQLPEESELKTQQITREVQEQNTETRTPVENTSSSSKEQQEIHNEQIEKTHITPTEDEIIETTEIEQGQASPSRKKAATFDVTQVFGSMGIKKT